MKLNLFIKTYCAILIGSLFSLTMCTEPQSYSTFRGDNQHSGNYTKTGISNPKLKWKTFLNGEVFSSPTILNNTVYIGSGDHNLYALNATNGKIIWNFKSSGAIHSTPAVNEKLIFFTSQDGNFYAIEKKSGKEIWKFKTGGEKHYSAINLFGYDTKGVELSDPWDFYLSSPIVENNIVYFGSGDSHIYALSAINGSLVWKFKTENVVHSSPAISNGIIYCGSFDSKLYALNAKNGIELWSFQAGIDEKYHLMCGVQASPSVINNTVFFGSRDAYVYALNALTGDLKWKQEFGGSWMPSSTAVTDEKLYVGSSDAKKYFSIDLETGNITDSIETNSYTFSSPAITGNTVLIGVFNGYLHAFDKNNGNLKWIFKADVNEEIRNKYLNNKGEIQKEIYEGLSFKDYSDANILLSRFYSLGAIISSPVVDNGTIYFSTADGYLYAIN